MIIDLFDFLMYKIELLMYKENWLYYSAPY